MVEDGALQLLQLRSRLDADPVHQLGACVTVGLERLGLAPRPVQRQHPLRVQLLAQRVLRHELVQLADDVSMATLVEVVLDRQLVCAHPSLVEPADLRGGERLLGHVGECLAAPERERLARAGLLHETLEPLDVDRVRRQAELIAATVGDDRRPVAVEQPP